MVFDSFADAADFWAASLRVMASFPVGNPPQTEGADLEDEVASTITCMSDDLRLAKRARLAEFTQVENLEGCRGVIAEAEDQDPEGSMKDAEARLGLREQHETRVLDEAAGAEAEDFE